MKVVLADGYNERVIRAAQEIVEDGIAVPVLIGREDKISEIAETHGLDLRGVEVVHPTVSDEVRHAYAEALYVSRKRKGLTRAEARSKMYQPSYFAGMMVRQGDADAVVYSSQGWDILKSKVLIALRTYHTQYPLRPGAPTQELRSRLGLSQPIYLKVLARLTGEDYLAEEGQHLRLPDHQVKLTPEMEQQLDRLLHHPAYDPHDREIPYANGETEQVNES